MSTDLDDAAAEQLQNELMQANLGNIAFDVQSTRPICMHLNADTSWLFSFPYPPGVQAPKGRLRYNIAIDVWLKGSQVDIHPWFSSQTHANRSKIQSFEELNDLLRKAELSVIGDGLEGGVDPYYIDAVCCSHEFTDHCHEETLKTLLNTVPICAPKKATILIKSWKHFQHVEEIPLYQSGSYEATGRASLLPSWLSLSRIQTQPPIYFHSALVFIFSLDGSDKEAIVYTPHGVAADRLAVIKEGEHSPAVLALLHGLHDVSLAGATLNMGMENAIKAQRLLHAKYWFPTHDEVKEAHGLVASLLQRVAHTVEVAPGSHPITDVTEHDVDQYQSMGKSSNFTSLGNGECFVLK